MDAPSIRREAADAQTIADLRRELDEARRTLSEIEAGATTGAGTLESARAAASYLRIRFDMACKQRDEARDVAIDHRVRLEEERTLRIAAEARASRYRARLARVLRVVKQDRDWCGVHDGAVWSRRVPPCHDETRTK